jgi:hypothetical protein
LATFPNTSPLRRLSTLEAQTQAQAICASDLREHEAGASVTLFCKLPIDRERKAEAGKAA